MIKVNDNQEFARWLDRWLAKIQQRRTAVDNKGRAEEQKRPSGTESGALANEKRLPKTYSKHG